MEVTVMITVDNWSYDPREELEPGVENPSYDPEPTTELRKPVCYVTVYQVTRHYGGCEEGGWWYNHYEPVCSVPLIEPGSMEEIEAIEAFLRPRFQDEGNIYSVRGGVEYMFLWEYYRGENETRHRPHYE